MEYKVVAPTVGESITEVRILSWKRKNGDAVKSGDILVEIETDKATVEVAAEQSGALTIITAEGTTIPIGALIATIDDAKTGAAVAQGGGATKGTSVPTPPTPAASSKAAAGSFRELDGVNPATMQMQRASTSAGANVTNSNQIIRTSQLLSATVNASGTPTASAAPQIPDRPGDRRVEMSRIRLKIAERLVEAQHTAAILTTFNEVDMTQVNAIRAKFKDEFKQKRKLPLSFMSFFTRAVVLSLQKFPDVNASIDGKDIVYHDYCDIGIAVGTDRGLVVPVLRDVNKMSFMDIDKGVLEFGEKAKTGKISIPDMMGGTFTISNGGTYGSLMSTPILNPPQSAILGMHKIQDRPMVIGGKVEVRPMMYLALSYDHRIIDGKGAVGFLVSVKELLEDPSKLQLEFL